MALEVNSYLYNSSISNIDYFKGTNVEEEGLDTYIGMHEQYVTSGLAKNNEEFLPLENVDVGIDGDLETLR